MAALLLAVACGSPANISALFAASTTPAAGASSGGGASDSSDGHAGTSPAAGSGSGTPGSAGSAGMANGGFSRGGADTGGAGGNSSGGAQNGGAVAGGPPMGGTAGTSSLGDCSMFGTDATYYSTNQHCYLAVHDAANFADAKSHCMNLGGHLVTLSDQQENDFVWGLDTNAHWIGATDGKDPKEPNPGTYTWVDGEPFTYTDWSAGQPNATMTTCPQGTNGGGACYEHCAFQWSGGATPGEWNDQLCLNAIEAVCEWDN